MSVGDVLGIVTILIKVGKDLYNRIDSIKQAPTDLQLLTDQLEVVSKVLKESENDIMAYSSGFTRMLNILKSIQDSYNKCAKTLGVEPAGIIIAAQKTAFHGKNFTKRVVIFARIPIILAEIREKAVQLDKISSILTVSILSEVRKHQKNSNGNEPHKSPVAIDTTLHDDWRYLNLSTGFVSIDRMVANLMKECKDLEHLLQETTLVPDTSAVEDYEAQNPEGASFWKDRFQNGNLYASALRYETFYVSWARFVHEVEKSFILKAVPTGIFETGNLDCIRAKGSRYSMNQSGTRCLSTIRPLWLPALRSALDPLHKGYVKPEDYFNLIHDCSLSDALRRLVFEGAGYGTLVQCERASGDLALPAAIESPSGHIGWLAAQIVAVPTPDELGIVTLRDVMASSSDALFAGFSGSPGDVHVYVRYLQTGQIERKSLSKQVRPVGSISVGVSLSIRRELDSGDHAWSCDLRISEFKACQGGEYVITACDGLTSVEFFTRPLKTSFDGMLSGIRNSSNFALPEFDCTLLGPSKVFIHPPKVGEKVQVCTTSQETSSDIF
ncbi:hypothetical protein EJ08DRAFT_654437 [Tothia fuscella]|uniref:Uncharacterized protein n=1 Tax=Tothia fuscella TaxID=1048955 RepID=A0A9P4TRR5_9PEZI|nr:hypothetical protein EJ08DRAFT_654437 [Tothia fuscella]